MTTMSRRTLGRAATLKFLDSLKDPRDTRTVYLPPGLSPDEITASANDPQGLYKIPVELPGLAAASGSGAVIFQMPESTTLVLPPFPMALKQIARQAAAEPLVSSIKQDYTVAIILVRLGAYAIGVCKGETLITSKVGTGLIHGRHRQGGSSAHRFERHRDKQIESFLTRAGQRAREQIEPHLKALDYAVYGGARTTVLLFQKQCDFLSRIKAPLLPPLLDIPEPRQAVLENAVSRIWSSTVIAWRED